MIGPCSGRTSAGRRGPGCASDRRIGGGGVGLPGFLGLSIKIGAEKRRGLNEPSASETGALTCISYGSLSGERSLLHVRDSERVALKRASEPLEVSDLTDAFSLRETPLPCRRPLFATALKNGTRLPDRRDMGRMLRIWRGEWRKNDSQYWHFVPVQTDLGLSLYMDEGESFATVEGIVRTHYGVRSTTELVDLMAGRPWMVEFTLLVTLGAKSVAQYHFNRRSPFYIGSSSFVVDQTQDANAKASYERLVFGKRMATSEKVMTEIFGEEEMVVFYRVAMEMEFAEKENTRQMDEQAQPGPWLICLDEDSEMEDASKGVGRMDSTMGGLNRGQGTLDKGKGIIQESVGQTKAPAVLWDVGIDVLTFPEFCNRERAAAMEASRNAFWEGVLREETKSTDETESTEDLPECDGGGAVGLGFKKGGAVVKEGVVVVTGDDGSSSTSDTAVICTQVGPKATSVRMEVRGVVETAVGVGSVSVDPLEDKGGRNAAKIPPIGDNLFAGSQGLPPPALMLTLACGEGEEKVGTKSTKTTEGSTHASDKKVGLETLKSITSLWV
ncbi:hypothetical protein YC2023_122080 [Brassica napus]